MRAYHACVIACAVDKLAPDDASLPPASKATNDTAWGWHCCQCLCKSTTLPCLQPQKMKPAGLSIEQQHMCMSCAPVHTLPCATHLLFVLNTRSRDRAKVSKLNTVDRLFPGAGAPMGCTHRQTMRHAGQRCFLTVVRIIHAALQVIQTRQRAHADETFFTSSASATDVPKHHDPCACCCQAHTLEVLTTRKTSYRPTAIEISTTSRICQKKPRATRRLHDCCMGAACKASVAHSRLRRFSKRWRQYSSASATAGQLRRATYKTMGSIL